MSRFIKPHSSDHVYVQFRFESSLRKYESKPTKRVKGEVTCANCCAHLHIRKVANSSPLNPRCSLPFSRGKGAGGEKTIERQSPEIHLVSSNKSIKLTKRKPLQASCGHNALQNKVYASLVKVEKVESRNGSDEEVYLNDFEPSVEMEREEEEVEGDIDFGRIEIYEQFAGKQEGRDERLQRDDQMVQRDGEKGQRDDEIGGQGEINEFVGSSKQQMEQNAIVVGQQQLQVGQKQQNELKSYIQQNIEQDSISLRIQNLKVVQEQQAEELDQLKQTSNPNQPSKPNPLLSTPPNEPNVEYSQPHFMQTPKASSHHQQSPTHQYPMLQHLSPQCPNNQYSSEQRARPIRARPQQDSIISSNLIEQNQMSESMMEKCLAFEGGRIYIDSSGQTFYISVRVFNKLRRNCAGLEDLISTLIAQRPYLEEKRGQLRHEFEEYLRKQV